MNITKRIEIDMGHRIPNHSSKCRNFHGHRYAFEATVDGNIVSTSGISDEGMVIDFGDLKKIMMDRIDHLYDHGFMIYAKDPYIDFFREQRDHSAMKIIEVPFVPTVEHIAIHVFNDLRTSLFGAGIRLVTLRVYETPTSYATACNGDRLNYES